jgi:peptide/nickel transport system substrate-binding protein
MAQHQPTRRQGGPDPRSGPLLNLPGLSASASRRSVLRASFGGAVLLGGGATLLDACGSSSSGSSSGGGSSSLVAGSGKIFESFDPYVGDLFSSVAYHTFFTYLIGYTNSLQPIPLMAQSWKIADDHKSVTIHLRKTNFQSGKPVTADDIIAGIKRQQDPDLGLALAQFGSLIDHAAKTSDQVVTVTFNQEVTDSFILDWMFSFPVIEADKNNADALQKAPAGCGPFELVSYKSGVELVMKKYDGYFEPGKPYLDQLTLKLFQDQATMAAALQSNAIDMALYIDPSQVSGLKDSYDVVAGQGLAFVRALYLSDKYEPWNNQKVRQAMFHAVDRDRICQEVWFGLSDPAYSIFAPKSPAWSDSFAQNLSFDLNAAKQLLDSSGAQMSGSIATPSDDPSRVSTLQIIQADLKKIGFDLKVDSMEHTRFSTLAHPGQLPGLITDTDGTFRDPAASVDPRLALTNNVMWPNGTPPDQWANAVKQAQSAFTPAAQQQGYQAMNQALADIGWVVGTDTNVNIFATAKNVTGFAPDLRDAPLLTDVKKS